jgi:hypothetical protein
MKKTVKYLFILSLAITFSSCMDDEEYDMDYLYGKWEVLKYEFTYLDEYYGWVTESEYPYNEGYYEDYTFKRDNIYYYLYEDNRDMELYKGYFIDYGDFLKLDNIMYSLLC